MMRVIVSAGFDDIRSHHVRFLHEASRLGRVVLLLWSDKMIRSVTGNPPKLPQEERLYLTQAVRYVDAVVVGRHTFDPHELPFVKGEIPKPDIWVVTEDSQSERKRSFCAAHEIRYRVIETRELEGFPHQESVEDREAAQKEAEAAQKEAEAAQKEADTAQKEPGAGRVRVMVTGCFDWFHSGHVRFFEEAAEYGDLYVVIGHDENVRLLKGEGHPLFPQDERRYMIQAVRYVKEAVISTGHGWMDAEPEVQRLKPGRYIVNEDGDKPEKRQFCEQYGIEYIVLNRVPRQGLTRRNSTELRGF